MATGQELREWGEMNGSGGIKSDGEERGMCVLSSF